MDRTWLAAGSVSMLLVVVAGAFGTHALRTRLKPDLLVVFETAVRYQAYHGLALLAVATLAARQGGVAVTVAGVAFVLGTILFSGSLYVMALTDQRWLGAVTPIGGVLFLVGWVALLYIALVMLLPPSLPPVR